MKGVDRPVALLMIFLFCLLLPVSRVFPAGTETKKEGGQAQSIVINADALEINDADKIVSFFGNVDAVKGNFRIKAEKMTLYYLGNATNGAPAGNETRIEKIVATGDVQIFREEGGEATAQEAIYYQGEEKVILTGNPKLKQGADFVEGSRVILFLDEKRSVVEGTEGNKVRAVLSPEGKNR
ncbi:MAG: lipopolysaccharide transport periplasmic protein LptA [Desulfatiglandales bacterium]